MSRAFLHKVMNQYHNKSITENEALGYKTTLEPLVNLNCKVSSLRNKSEEYIMKEFIKAYYISPKYAVKWLFPYLECCFPLHRNHGFRKQEYLL